MSPFQGSLSMLTDNPRLKTLGYHILPLQGRFDKYMTPLGYRDRFDAPLKALVYYMLSL